MEASKLSNGSDKKRKFEMPHTMVIIVAMIALVAIATYLIHGGAYETTVNESGKTVVVNGTFKYIESQPQNIFKVLQAPIQGLVDGAETIAFLFIVGGAFSIISKTKAIDFGILRIVEIFKGKEIFVLPILMSLFSLGGATFGMSEEAVAFITLLLPLILALGYDSIVAVAVTYLACVLGFSTAMLNPFTVGIAQSIAEIPIYSGMLYRTILWVITTAIGIGFVMLYAVKVKKNPEISPMYEIDKNKREKLDHISSEEVEFTFAHKIIILTLFLGIALIIWGVLKLGFWIPELGGIFLAIGIISGIAGRLSANEIATTFIEGAKDMIGAAIMIGFARAIMIVAQNAFIIDTILYTLANLIGQLPKLIAAYIMYPVQMFINFFVNSGSGQAALTMPILAPLGDLVGISRQLTVLIFQLGDGFSNALFPTSGILIACLGVAGVPYGKWLKWVIPLQIILFVCALGFITVASLIGWA